MKAAKSAIKLICFIGIFVLLFLYVQEILRDKWMEGEYDPSVKIKGFYAEEENSLDVIFIGSSQVYADIAPAVLYEEYGIASYDFCANEQPLSVSYYYIKEALRTQNPKVIVLDVFTVYAEGYEEEGQVHQNLDDMPFSYNKLCAIWDSVPADMRYSYYFPLAKYHNTWTDLYQGKAEYGFYHERDPYKGWSPFVYPAPFEAGAPARAEVAGQKESTPIPDYAKEWLYKIIDLCKEENVPLLLIKTPNGNGERQKLYNSVAELAFETDTPFVNMNVIFDGQAHINVLHAEKVTSYLGDYLVSHYDLPDRRMDPAYASWEEDAALFYRQKAKCSLLVAEDFSEYIPFLSDENFVVCISAKNSAGNPFSEEDMTLLNEALGLHCQLGENPSGAYCAVIDGKEVLYETAEPGKAQDTAETVVSGLSIQVTSYGMNAEESPAILINGTDFSLDVNGFNIAVYDKVLGEVFEMSAFDLDDGMRLVR